MASTDFDPDTQKADESAKTPAQSLNTSASVKAPVTPSIGKPRTEQPIEPRNPYQPFTREEETPIGNQKALLALRLEGQLGVFYDRTATTRVPTHVNVLATNFRTVTYNVLVSVIAQELRKQQSLDANTIQAESDRLANVLADGVNVMMYLKLRSVNYHDQTLAARFRRKPKVPVPFEVPQPYALAISQLGQIKLSGLEAERYYTPTLSAPDAANFTLPANRVWIPSLYSQAVEEAKKIGLHFSSVDLSVKMGSSWWIYRPTVDQGTVTLELPAPEENFTENTATLATLFIAPDAHGVYHSTIDTAPLGADNYGSMARIPFPYIAVNTYYAICDVSSVNFKVTN